MCLFQILPLLVSCTKNSVSTRAAGLLVPKVLSSTLEARCVKCSCKWTALIFEPSLLAQESHPLIRKSASIRVNHLSDETSLFQCFCLLDSFVMLFPTLFCSPPVVALNIMRQKQQPWLEAISLLPPPWELLSKPTALSGTVGAKRKGESGS